MHNYLILLRRELGCYFLSLTGYVIIAGALILLGLGFAVMLLAYNGDTIDMPLTELFYGTMFFWLIVLVATPVITMRLFAMERATGTFETLMTAPVGDGQVVLAKFTAAFLFYLVMWLPLASCLRLVHHYTAAGLEFDWWPVISTYIGILLIGSLYIAIGCLASALTRSQIIAAMTSFAMGVSLFLLSFLRFSVGQRSGFAAQVATYTSMFDHMEDFVRGVVDTRHIVFYLTLTGICLFLTLKVVEGRRWR
ncbi:MAG: ABC transporter permease [Verrucomicrobiia bacterium]